MIQSLRSVIGIGPSRKKTRCVAQLIDAYGKIKLDDGHETRQHFMNTPVGKRSYDVFLKVLEHTCTILNIEMTSREYRDSFSPNYRPLFPSKRRAYRYDIFKACLEQERSVYVNGDKFELGAETVRCGLVLQIAFHDLTSILEEAHVSNCWKKCPQREDVESMLFNFPVPMPYSWAGLEDVQKAGLGSVLIRLDSSWAEFEKAYVSDLIKIESQARGYIVKAVEMERELTLAEASENMDGVAERRLELVESIARLNSVANNRRKGRDDFDSSILEEALTVRESARQIHLERSTFTVPTMVLSGSTTLLLAEDVMKPFDALRAYFRQVPKFMEHVDPQLCNNAGLVDRLVDWEESWEVGSKYLRRSQLLNALSDMVAELRAVQDMLPSFRQMCENCDVEVFLCLPRLILLRFLAEPVECGELLKDLLPHRFSSAASVSEMIGDAGSGCDNTVARQSLTLPGAISCAGDPDSDALGFFPVDHDLKGLQTSYHRVCQQLLQTPANIVRPAFSRSPRPIGCEKTVPASSPVFITWELLTRRVVAGSKSDSLYGLFLLPSAEGEAVKTSVEGFVLELERWSLELQRHCPQDWNQCSALLLHCLGGTEQLEQTHAARFHV